MTGGKRTPFCDTLEEGIGTLVPARTIGGLMVQLVDLMTAPLWRHLWQSMSQATQTLTLHRPSTRSSCSR